jgi:hypothetical protein
MRRFLTIFAAVFALTTSARANDAYLFRFAARGASVACAGMAWADDALLYNGNSTPVSVALVGLSSGGVAPGTPTTITIPPGRVVSLNAATAAAPWRPADPAAPPIAVAHLDVPAGVTIDSRDEYFAVDAPCTVVQHYRYSVGKVPLPVYRTLTPAGQDKVHVGTDLGQREVRVNVTVYNAGDQEATARLELRRACDGSVDDSATIVVPPKTALQYGSLHKGSDVCTDPTTLTPAYLRYTVVHVDRPSLSYVSVLGPVSPIDELHLTPAVELAVALNTDF